jgi:adenylate kinase
VNLILLGAPGAGKGTQGALLAERLGLARLSTGDLLRQAVRDGTELGRAAQRYMDAGELVPDAVILGLVRDTMTVERAAGAGGFIFDGFPRTVPQAEALDVLLRELDEPLDAVVVLEVPDDTLVRRLSGRRTCRACGRIHNVYFDPPAQSGRCDTCGSELTQRADDAAETVRRRLEVYRAQTAPLIGYYRASPAPVVELEGDREVEAVQAAAVEALGR